MSKRKIMVTLFKGGLNEKTLPIDEVIIPDLWHIAQAVKEGKVMGKREREKAGESRSFSEDA